MSYDVVELFDGDKTIIKDYDLKSNIYSDHNFSIYTLDKLTNDPAVKGDPDNPFKLFMSGGYYTYQLGKKL